MKTALKNISELEPGDKLYLPWPKEQQKPEWHKLPEIVTVKSIDGREIIIKESGGLSITAVEIKEFQVVVSEMPEPGDTIHFNMEEYDVHGLKTNKSISAIVESIIRDSLKRFEPKCRVSVDQELYGIPFSEVVKIEKPFRKRPSNEIPQLQLF